MHELQFTKLETDASQMRAKLQRDGDESGDRFKTQVLYALAFIIKLLIEIARD